MSRPWHTQMRDRYAFEHVEPFFHFVEGRQRPRRDRVLMIVRDRAYGRVALTVVVKCEVESVDLLSEEYLMNLIGETRFLRDKPVEVYRGIAQNHGWALVAYPKGSHERTEMLRMWRSKECQEAVAKCCAQWGL